MERDPFERVDIGISLQAHEFEIAETLAEMAGFSSAHEYVEYFVASTLLNVGDTEEVPYLPARAHKKKTMQILQSAGINQEKYE